ncbi:hypothetical protein NKH18_40500 [Streptomyces sp. M10(2022)]
MVDNSNEPHIAHKTHLPHPYDQDISHVLRHLSRITATGRKKLANSLSTAGYLAAGMRLIQQHLGPDAVRSAAAAANGHCLERPCWDSCPNGRSPQQSPKTRPVPQPGRCAEAADHMEVAVGLRRRPDQLRHVADELPPRISGTEGGHHKETRDR